MAVYREGMTALLKIRVELLHSASPNSEATLISTTVKTIRAINPRKKCCADWLQGCRDHGLSFFQSIIKFVRTKNAEPYAFLVRLKQIEAYWTGWSSISSVFVSWKAHMSTFFLTNISSTATFLRSPLMFHVPSERESVCDFGRFWHILGIHLMPHHRNSINQ